MIVKEFIFILNILIGDLSWISTIHGQGKFPPSLSKDAYDIYSYSCAKLLNVKLLNLFDYLRIEQI